PQRPGTRGVDVPVRVRMGWVGGRVNVGHANRPKLLGAARLAAATIVCTHPSRVRPDRHRTSSPPLHSGVPPLSLRALTRSRAKACFVYFFATPGKPGVTNATAPSEGAGSPHRTGPARGALPHHHPPRLLRQFLLGLVQLVDLAEQ